MDRVADALADDDLHFQNLAELLSLQKFLPAGRVQAAMGSGRHVTPYNCYVAPTIPDTMDGIMDGAKFSAKTMKLGGGMGYDFSPLRPRYATIRSLDSHSSGPVSFMGIFDAMCATISSAGHRRGAQMGMLRVDHPDILEFVDAKANHDTLTNFNLSVAVTDEFMTAVRNGDVFPLRFEGKVYNWVGARYLWNKIMSATWDWAEPGVVFIDRVNAMNNLWYCETIAATNPCAEQPLPPYGACLLGSINLAKYVEEGDEGHLVIRLRDILEDIPTIVRAMDNVVDRAVYPHPEQENEAKSKRRMGLGVTGVANALEAIGHPYGTVGFRRILNEILRAITNETYRASAKLAREKGPFPLFDREKYLKSAFVQGLDKDTRECIYLHGIRNSHLMSIAPTGTISLAADNVSSGIEPVFSHGFTRTINMPDGLREEHVDDYGVRVFDHYGRTADKLTVQDHVDVLNVAAYWMDSSVSKTCNVGADVTFQEFKDVYWKAYLGGSKGCTTYRASGKRHGILNADESGPVHEGSACYIDPETNTRTCE
ncbi:adenosylcobalamin-dependent ribonucleoside-diphosphate reductase [Marivibrio halodurans]|uniref:Vitamin B12-dependent ribonucleotide reductase n=2 Tax=Marivibrio halodurans TaxID=2039722 RepID=A0A8J7V0V3_9PROT|nr:adenosylcobalamin-dependent ribonucleoside-diphosphate reductase [Marivibrio halodurans]